MDILSEVLRAQHLHGTVYFRADFREPWGLDIQGGEFANFHIVAAGQCWLRHGPAGTQTCTLLEMGDVVVFPHGSPHALLHAPDATPVPARRLLGQPADKEHPEATPEFGGGGAVTTRLVCGHFAYDRQCPHPLFETLPPIVHVRGSASAGARWLATAGELAAAESSANRPGAAAVVDRLAEALLIQSLLGFVAQLDPMESRSFLAAIQDRSIGRALNLMHTVITRDWTLEELSREAGVSRSVFTERFKVLVGTSPMLYLARWRMLKARGLLRESSLSVAQIADLVGYQSEFSLSKAFKRLFGMAPGAFRNSPWLDPKPGTAARLRPPAAGASSSARRPARRTAG
ncbi:MAG: AraC family transcriptional regulator [Opitutae bacterium]|nr:AraC family transcriptional regulator [Opitutae bacterium]